MTPYTLSRRAVLGLGAALVSIPMASASPMPPGFADYNKETFPAILKGTKPVLVHVHADWCPVCVRQSKTFTELSGTPDLKKFAAVQVNFDMDLDFRKTFNVNNQSVILVFKGGKEVARVGGISDKAKIAEFLAKALAAGA